MRYRKGRGDGNSLMQVAAAVVGSAAAAQHIPTEPQHAHTLGSPCPVSGCRWPMPELCCPDHDPDGVEDIQCCDDCPIAAAEEADTQVRLAAEWERVDPATRWPTAAALRASAAALPRCCVQHEEVESITCCPGCPNDESWAADADRSVEKVSPAFLAEVRAAVARMADSSGLKALHVQSALARKVHIGWVQDALERMEIGGELCRAGDWYFLPAPAPDLSSTATALDVHQALNTYEVAADVPQTYEDVTPHMALVIGANHRKLIARWDTDGLWLGGCLITDRGVAEKLASFITREDEDA